MLTYLLIFLKIISPKRLDFVGSVVAVFFDWKVGKKVLSKVENGKWVIQK
jgi:hypothetical protein